MVHGQLAYPWENLRHLDQHLEAPGRHVLSQDSSIQYPSAGHTSYVGEVSSSLHGVHDTTPWSHNPNEPCTTPSMGISTADVSTNPALLASDIIAGLINGLSRTVESRSDTGFRPSPCLEPDDHGHSEYCGTQDGQTLNSSQECRCQVCLTHAPFVDLCPCPGPEKCKDLCGPLSLWHPLEAGKKVIYRCPIADCQFRLCQWPHLNNNSDWRKHLQSHSGKPGEYHCTAKYCPMINKPFKRWAELARHCEGAHCKNAKRYRCHVLGCKYHDTLSFARKDKLTSHIRNVHAGQVAPGQGLRKLKLKAKKDESRETKV